MEARVMEQFNYWLNDPYFDDATKQELLAIRNDPKEVEDRFYKDLAFGTGGLRGVIGAGTNRMNLYTVRKATQGLANYINKNGDPALQRTESRRIFPTRSVRFRRSPLHSAILGARQALRSQHPTTRRNTTDTRSIGRTAHRLRRRTTQASLRM